MTEIVGALAFAVLAIIVALIWYAASISKNQRDIDRLYELSALQNKINKEHCAWMKHHTELHSKYLSGESRTRGAAGKDRPRDN